MEFYEDLASEFYKRLRAQDGGGQEAETKLALALMKETGFQALREIWETVKDDSLDDPTCFRRIERIVEVYEDLGAGAGTRHDFG